jgi:hypothetical protein
LAEIGVNRQTFPCQLASLAPPPARRVSLLTPVLSPGEDRYRGRFATLQEGALDHLLQLLSELVARGDEDGGLPEDAGLILIGERQEARVLPFLLRSIADCLVDSLSRLAQPRRAFDEQAPDALPVRGSQSEEEEPLDDLAQPLLGVLCREEGGAGGRRSRLQDWLLVAMGWREADTQRVGRNGLSRSGVGHLG